MIALDTNILVYAHRKDLPFHGSALRCLEGLAIGSETWAIPWPCVHEFISVVTNKRTFTPPSTIEEALGQVALWVSSPNLVLLYETDEHWSVLSRTIRLAEATGGQVHDARIAALCIEHGARELWTLDRDFARFTELATFNPLTDDQIHDHSPAYAAIKRARAAGRRRSLASRQLPVG